MNVEAESQSEPAESLAEKQRRYVFFGAFAYAAVEANDAEKVKRLSPQLVQALSEFRTDLEEVGLSPAEDRLLARAIGGPDTGSLQTELTHLIERHDALERRVDDLDAVNERVGDVEKRLNAAAAAERREAEFRWAKAAARFLIGATVGAAIAGPLIAIVPWPQMVGEIVKNAISGASGVLATEIGDPLTKGR